MKKNNVSIGLNWWKNALFKRYGKDHILNIALYGSQNYGIDTELSDVDVKAIYIPSLKEAIVNQNWLSKEITNEEGEHCEIKDIREMFKMYKKQNLNFLETLYTEHRWDNPDYQDINNILKTNKENIANYNPQAIIKTTCGRALNSIYQFEKKPQNKKKLAEILYLYLFICKYEEKRDYKTCFYVNKNETIFNLPAKEVLISLKKQKDVINVDISFLEKFFREIFNESKFSINKRKKEYIDNLLEKLSYDAIMRNNYIETQKKISNF